MQNNNTTSSFWAHPAMQARLAQRQARLASHPDQDPDLDLRKIIDLDRSRTVVTNSPNRNDLDPDGLNSKIRGEYAELLKQDPAFLMARSWGVHPATLTNATKRMGSDWVRKQITFVDMKKGVANRGKYLSSILARNPF